MPAVGYVFEHSPKVYYKTLINLSTGAITIDSETGFFKYAPKFLFLYVPLLFWFVMCLSIVCKGTLTDFGNIIIWGPVSLASLYCFAYLLALLITQTI